MAKCQHYTTRERIAGLLPCKQDAVIRIGEENLCAKHADPNVLTALRLLKKNRNQTLALGEADSTIAALEPKEATDHE